MQPTGSNDARLAHRLREIDPARDVAPIPEHRIEEIMTNTIRSTSEEARSAGAAEPRARCRLGVAGAVATATAAAIVTALALGQPGPGGTLALTLPPDGVQTACAPISPEFVAASDVAFEGRVTKIDDSTVTLQVLRQYAGEAAATATIPQGTDELTELTSADLKSAATTSSARRMG